MLKMDKNTTVAELVKNGVIDSYSKKILEREGFRTIQSFKGITIDDLLHIRNLSIRNARNLLEVINKYVDKKLMVFSNHIILVESK